MDDLTFEVAFADLERGQYLDLTAWLTTDADDSRRQLTALAHLGRHQVDLYAPDASSTCEAATVDVDYTSDMLTMSVPRSCLDEPRWIEVEVVASTMEYDASPDAPGADLVRQDDAFQEGFTRSRGEAGPRLHHP
ncbi:hypothetical protein [Nocardioides sp. Soil805]|uniref:hypothetical protein n=1 Tax=Nocardioides sp. Soil805 TaxID=1736416 RepID=UPI0007031FAC|nr:hypothetical protein [Nocardioides sp. Soil805]KRF34073.1 hypothetical protein ASG94_15130 [Nocardioides sp. Soil805]